MPTQAIERGQRIWVIAVQSGPHQWVTDRDRIFLSLASARKAWRALGAVPGNGRSIQCRWDEYAPEVYGDAEVVP